MRLVIQSITVGWTKASRGGKGAALRNAVPEALPLMNVPDTTEPLALVHQSVGFHEIYKFQRPQIAIKTEAIPPERWLHYPCIQVQIIGQQALVRYTYSTAVAGMPRRDEFPREYKLSIGEWMRVKFNGRFSDWDTGGWYYRKTVLNIGLFDHAVRKAFLGEPMRSFTDMAIMW